MSTYHDLVQRTVVSAVAVVSALRNGTLDALVCIAVHNVFPPFYWDMTSMSANFSFMQITVCRTCSVGEDH